METSRTPAPAGTQSLGRGIRLLRMIATRGEVGWRLSDLAAACRLDKGTAHRLLSALLSERLVQQRHDDKRYLAGPMLFELGLALPGQHAFQAEAEALLAPWARRMDANVLLLLRSGSDFVCSVQTGPSKIPGLMVVRGTRRPLFTSVGGAAMLLAMPPDEVDEALAHNTAQEIAARGEGRLGALRQMRERSARHGFGVNLGDVVAGVHSFGMVVRYPDTTVLAGLCLVGTVERFPQSQLEEIRLELTRVAHELEGLAAKFNM